LGREGRAKDRDPALFEVTLLAIIRRAKLYSRLKKRARRTQALDFTRLFMNLERRSKYRRIGKTEVLKDSDPVQVPTRCISHLTASLGV
jgi:DNA-binding LytR/AlgR family response regulator